LGEGEAGSETRSGCEELGIVCLQPIIVTSRKREVQQKMEMRRDIKVSFSSEEYRLGAG
jgi:hypothetical protein